MSDYLAFCAENDAASSPFRSIACVSLPAAVQPSFSSALSGALSPGDASQPLPAIRLVDATLAGLGYGVRLDVLMWDEREPRNFLEPRDGTSLEAMSYHLLTAVMRTRPASGWRIHYGRGGTGGWPTLADCTGAPVRRGPPERLLFVDFAKGTSHVIQEAAEVDERDSVEIQLADLFATLMVFSRTSYVRFQAWSSGHVASPGFEPNEVVSFKLIAHLNAEAKRAKLGVSFASTGGLRTRDGRRPLNFWWYEAIVR